MSDQPADRWREEELVSRAQRLDAAAWADIYSAHQPRIYRYVRARVYEEATAEDLTANVFLDALEGIGRYRQRGRPLLAWLFRIARHVVADHQRKLFLRNRLFAPLLTDRLLPGSPGGERPGGGFGDRAASHDHDPSNRIQRLDLDKAISGLPRSQREVVILRHFVGLSTAEMSAVMGRQPSALYSLEARALLSLRKTLDESKISFSGSDEKPPVRAINILMEPVDKA